MPGANTGLVFFDTNILIYEFDARVPEKQQVAQNLVKSALFADTAVISYQVIQEFLNIMSSRFAHPLSPADLQLYLLRKLWPMSKVLPTPGLFTTALRLREDAGYSFYDSLIVSAALLADCRVLYSEDLQHGRRFGGLEIRNPFA